ncbi:MAG: hypothetical protein Q9201_005449 [Fulgogasparrea decipioides]
MDPFKLLSRSTKLQNSSTSTGARVRHVPSAADSGHLENYVPSHTSYDQSVSSGQKRKRHRNRSTSSQVSQVSQDLNFFHTSAASNSRTDGSLQTHETKEGQSEKRIQVQRSPEALDQNECRRILRQNKLKITLLGTSPLDEEQRKRRHKRLSGRLDENSRPERVRIQLTIQPLQSFGDLVTKYKVSERLGNNLDAQGYRSPTEVQLGALPIFLGSDRDRGLQLKGNDEPDIDHRSEVDLLTVAPTGSGKTLAFLIPLLHGLVQDRRQRKSKVDPGAKQNPIQALILAPTHELVDQTVNEGKKLAFGTSIRITRMRKGMRLDPIDLIPDQKNSSEGPADGLVEDGGAKSIKVKADILVSTPLLLIHAKEERPQAAAEAMVHVRYLVLDEADVLLDPLFRTQSLDVWNLCTNPNLQTSLWSATIGSSIESLAQAVILDRRRKLGLPTGQQEHHIVRLVVGLKDSAVPNISHQLVYAATEQGKLMAMRQLIHPTAVTTRNGPPLLPPFLVFTQSIPRAIALHSELLYDISPEAGGSSRIAVLHSGLSDTARSAVMARFRKGEIWILITTDLLARGVDFRGVNGVVNYDIPNTSGIYVHRVGRTGRQGREGGTAVTLYTREDIKYVKTVANVIAASEKQKDKSQGPQDKEGLQKWLLDALPDVSKKTRKELKRSGVEGRRTTIKADVDGREARRMRISTKSGYDRRLEQKRKAAVRGARSKPGNQDLDDDWGGIKD